jgi:hypothetical protein
MAQDSSLPGFWDTRYREGVTPWDAGGVPPQLLKWLKRRSKATVLVPGCGAGYEVLGPFAHLVKKVDFFSFATASYDVVYEQMRLDELLRPFFTLEGCADIPPAQSIPVFKRKECWQVWRRKL